VHGASLSGLNIVRISILMQSWETFYKISPRQRSEQKHLLSLRTTQSFLCLNNKQKGNLSKFPNKSFSQQFSCFLDMTQSSTRNKAKLTVQLLKLCRIFIQKWGSLKYQFEILKELQKSSFTIFLQQFTPQVWKRILSSINSVSQDKETDEECYEKP